MVNYFHSVLIVIALIFCNCSLAFSQNLKTILLEKSKKEISLQNQSVIYFDVNHSIGIKDIPYLLKNNHFRLFNQHIIQASKTDAVVWMAFKVKGEKNLKATNWFLQLDKKIISYIDLMYIEDNKLHTIATGNSRPKSIEHYKKLKFYLPIHIKPSEERTYFLKLKSDAALNFNLLLLEDDYLFQKNAHFYFWYGLFVGLILVSIIISITIYFIILKKGYLLFGIYTFAALIFYLINSGFYAIIIGFEIGKHIDITYIIIYALLHAIAAYYGNEFLHLKKYHQKIYQVLLIETILPFFMIAGAFFMDKDFIILCLHLNALFLLSIGVAASWIVFHKGNKTAIYYLIGYTFYFLGGLLDILEGYGYISSNIITTNGGEFGVVLESFFLLSGLMLKYRYEKKLYYAKIKKSQEEKFKIQIEATELLEKKIAERTATLDALVEKLFLKNELLMQRQEEILNQRDLLDEKNKKLDELNMTKNKFFSILSHDIRSPLNSLIGFSEVISNGIKTEDKATISFMAQKLNESSKNVLELIDNLLQWSLSQSNGLQLKKENFSINDSIKKNIELLSPIAERKNIVLEFDNSKNYIVDADQNTIKTVLRNLISNAIKFSFRDQKIQIKLQEQGNMLAVSIIDAGLGMNKEQINKLFRIDYKQSTMGTLQEKGTGIGLILTKEFVDLNGGSISVESKEMIGSNFTFTIPLVPIPTNPPSIDQKLFDNYWYN